jgi:hypothetical protein
MLPGPFHDDSREHCLVAQPQHNEALARRRGSTLSRAFAVTSTAGLMHTASKHQARLVSLDYQEEVETRSVERAIDTVLARRQAREQQDR